MKFEFCMLKNTTQADFYLKISTPGIVAAIRSSGKKFWKYNTGVKGIQKFLCVVNRYEKKWFFVKTTFLAPAIFWPSLQIWWIKKGPEPKKLLKQKIIFFIFINCAKEFLNSLHTGVVFSELFPRASYGRRYSRNWNFQLKISLGSVF